LEGVHRAGFIVGTLTGGLLGFALGTRTRIGDFGSVGFCRNPLAGSRVGTLLGFKHGLGDRLGFGFCLRAGLGLDVRFAFRLIAAFGSVPRLRIGFRVCYRRRFGLPIRVQAAHRLLLELVLRERTRTRCLRRFLLGSAARARRFSRVQLGGKARSGNALGRSLRLDTRGSLSLELGLGLSALLFRFEGLLFGNRAGFSGLGGARLDSRAGFRKRFGAAFRFAPDDRLLLRFVLD
jgi:hypothetical protein